MKKLQQLKSIKTPAYVLDEESLIKNLERFKYLKNKTGIKIIFATKSFALFSAFPLISEYLDGTTASGLFEAKLGAEEFKKEVHVYSPAYSDDEINDIIKIASHIYFNSITQLNKYYDLVYSKKIKIGLRVNPELSLVKNSILYDPSSENSRFGVKKEEITDEVLSKVSSLHFHNLCENLSDDSKRLIEHISDKFSQELSKISDINFGGGHYITHKDYDIEKLISAINNFQQKHNISVTMEPGGAVVYNAGYLVSEVQDVIIRKDSKIAILDTSATCHMPDVLEVPYQPEIEDAKISQELDSNTYIITGKTCLTGDVIGKYDFIKPLNIGDKIIFKDMMQYSFVKNNTFNGMPLPDLGVLDRKNNYRIIKSFGYQDFKDRLS